MKIKPNTPQKYGYAHRVLPIRKRIRQKVLLRWLVILLVGAVFALFCIISQPFFRRARDFQLNVGGTMLIYAFIIWKSRLLPYTFSKGWTGRVRGREVQKYTKMPKGLAAMSRRPPIISTKCIWSVETDDGYLEKVAYDTEDIWEGYFQIGERVRLYKNAKILVKAHPQEGDENLMCPLCGEMVLKPICRKCGADFAEREETP